DNGTPTPSSQPTTSSSNDVTFNLVHPVPSPNHTLRATLTQGGFVVTDTVQFVGVGNPCPLHIAGLEGFFEALPALPANAPLSGTCKSNVGNRVIILVEEPVYVNGQLMQPRLDFADPAEVGFEKDPPNTGTWKHAAIPGAKKGQHV